MRVWNWTGMRADRFKAASAFTGFHKELASSLAANELRGCARVWDVGCGLGLLSLALAGHVDQITATDINADAIVSLQGDMASLGISNILVRQEDCLVHREKHDAAVMCFFRAVEFERLLPLCDRLVMVVNRGADYLSADDGSGRHCSRESMDSMLWRKGFTFTCRELGLEFGQPLRDLEDARDFVRSQTPGVTEAQVEAYLERRLAKTEDPAYPLYIPHRKEVGIYCIDREVQML